MRSPTHKEMVATMKEMGAIEIKQFRGENNWLNTQARFKNEGFGPPVVLRYCNGTLSMGLHPSSYGGVSFFEAGAAESFADIFNRLLALKHLINGGKV